jgi:hypothetical protein
MGPFFLEDGPKFNCSIRDYKRGDTDASDPRSSQMTLHVRKGHPARGLPELVRKCMRESEKTKVDFIKNVKVEAA